MVPKSECAASLSAFPSLNSSLSLYSRIKQYPALIRFVLMVVEEETFIQTHALGNEFQHQLLDPITGREEVGEEFTESRKDFFGDPDI